MKYCTCQQPKRFKSGAAGKSFYICKLSEGGCGEEIIDNQFVVNMNIKLNNPIDFIITDIKLSDIKVDGPQSGEVICPECEGGCFKMVCYGGMPIEKSCEYCDGRGAVDDD